VSSNFPEYPSTFDEDSSTDYEPPFVARDWIVSISLLLATLLTATLAGIAYRTGFDILGALQLVKRRPELALHDGLAFSLPLIAILLAHELGHFLACRYYGMNCTPPYFIPLPIPISGTLGAFIKIKSRFLNRNALFDVGIAGPLAGFLFLLPTLYIGISLSHLIPKGIVGHNDVGFGEPIIFRWFGQLILGYKPDKQDILVHPFAMAAWVGLLSTSLNLLPIWQLDGGHISYAMTGRSWHKKLSIASLIALIIVSLSVWQQPLPPYLLFIVLLLIVGIKSRFYHPPAIFEEERLGAGRFLLGLLAFFILAISFMPAPILLP
jgi:membrane-associated protease RseP (regulator of RpoE activity)